MQLKIRRSQRETGMIGKKTLFAIDARVEFTPDEADNIRKYQLGKEVMYSSATANKLAAAALDHVNSAGGLLKSVTANALLAFTLVITIDGLTKGQNIECKTLDEVLGVEEALRTACQNIQVYLQTAATFDGTEVVLDFNQ